MLRRWSMRDLFRFVSTREGVEHLRDFWDLQYGTDERGRPLIYGNIMQYIEAMQHDATYAADHLHWGSAQDALPLANFLGRTIIVLHRRNFIDRPTGRTTSRWSLRINTPNYQQAEVNLVNIF